MIDPAFWHGRRVFVTGHTGFKGSWLCLWLAQMGADLTGFALAPDTTPSLFERAGVAQGMHSVIGDIRDPAAIQAAMHQARPEIVLHLAAQALVRPSYADPAATYATNVMGLVHVLEAVRRTPSVTAMVNVTSDKCYENREWLWGYREDEPMGGFDPYSSSKGCAELVTSAYRRSFFAQGAALASGRAGNVIGGGDWALDRLVPDIMRAIVQNQPVRVRNPHAIRPWQHVLEPLSGYLTLAERLVTHGSDHAEAWNFGPSNDDSIPVAELAGRLTALWGYGATWQLDPDAANQPHEAHYLKLDCSKAAARLGWRPRWRLETALASIVAFHQAAAAGHDLRAVALRQIDDYANSPPMPPITGKPRHETPRRPA